MNHTLAPPPEMETKRPVCVTGGSGFIGSYLVKLLLSRGYSVHSTVQNLEDGKETDHLRALEAEEPGGEGRLRLFQMDLLDYDSIAAAVAGTVGVFHVASPNVIDRVRDPQGQLLAPAVEGTMNVLAAAKAAGVRRVVVTSSTAAIFPSPNWPAGVVKDESCWTDVDYCRQKELWYPVSKTLAEKAASEFAEKNGLDVVVINPGVVMGPIIPPTVNASMNLLLHLIQGLMESYEDIYMGLVHVKDVALAHILLYENSSASGRHLCVEAISHFSDFAARVADLYPEYKVPRFPKDSQPGLVRASNPSKKLIDIGLRFANMDEIIKDAVHCLKTRGYMS